MIAKGIPTENVEQKETKTVSETKEEEDSGESNAVDEEGVDMDVISQMNASAMRTFEDLIQSPDLASARAAIEKLDGTLSNFSN